MEEIFLKKLKNDSKKIINAILSDDHLKNESIEWGKNIFIKNINLMQNLINQIKMLYPSDIEKNTIIYKSIFDIKKCGNIPCIYESFLQNKENVIEIIENNNLELVDELKIILNKKENGLNHFQEFINKMKDLSLLQKITQSIKTDKSQEFFQIYLYLLKFSLKWKNLKNYG